VNGEVCRALGINEAGTDDAHNAAVIECVQPRRVPGSWSSGACLWPSVRINRSVRLCYATSAGHPFCSKALRSPTSPKANTARRSPPGVRRHNPVFALAMVKPGDRRRWFVTDVGLLACG